MTDAELDALIETARPSLRNAIKSVLGQKQYAVMVPLGAIKFPNDQSWDVTCFVLIEPITRLIAPLVIHGIPNMMASQAKPHLKPGEQLPGTAPAPPSRPTSGLGSLMPD